MKCIVHTKNIVEYKLKTLSFNAASCPNPHTIDMLKKLVLFGLLAGDAMARLSGPAEEDALDLEVVVEGGERKLFPLLPGTKCPAGHRCHASKHRASRSVDKSRSGVVPLMSSIKDNMKNPLTVAEQNSFDNDLTTMVESNDYCTRRNALARAAGLAAGLTVSMVNSPVYAAQTASVNMGTDSGQLVFQPDKLKICVGDSVSWYVFRFLAHEIVLFVCFTLLESRDNKYIDPNYRPLMLCVCVCLMIGLL